MAQVPVMPKALTHSGSPSDGMLHFSSGYHSSVGQGLRLPEKSSASELTDKNLLFHPSNDAVPDTMGTSSQEMNSKLARQPSMGQDLASPAERFSTRDNVESDKQLSEDPGSEKDDEKGQTSKQKKKKNKRRNKNKKSGPERPERAGAQGNDEQPVRSEFLQKLVDQL